MPIPTMARQEYAREKAAGGRFIPPHVPPQKMELKTNIFWNGGSKAMLLARQEGLEPPTYCLEGSCSIQLSYWRIWSE